MGAAAFAEALDCPHACAIVVVSVAGLGAVGVGVGAGYAAFTTVTALFVILCSQGLDHRNKERMRELSTDARKAQRLLNQRALVEPVQEPQPARRRSSVLEEPEQ